MCCYTMLKFLIASECYSFPVSQAALLAEFGIPQNKNAHRALPDVLYLAKVDSLCYILYSIELCQHGCKGNLNLSVR